MKKFVIVTGLFFCTAGFASSYDPMDLLGLFNRSTTNFYKVSGGVVGGFAGYGFGHLFFGDRAALGIGVLGVVAGYKVGGSLGDTNKRLEDINNQISIGADLVRGNINLTAATAYNQAQANGLMSAGFWFMFQGNVTDAQRCFFQSAQTSFNLADQLVTTHPPVLLQMHQLNTPLNTPSRLTNFYSN